MATLLKSIARRVMSDTLYRNGGKRGSWAHRNRSPFLDEIELVSMSLEGTGVADIIPDVLRSWDIVPDGVSPISTNGNCHWRVRTGRDEFVLRMYRSGQSAYSIQYELDILERLRIRGLPVAAAVGNSVLHSGFRFALFPLLRGSPRLKENDDQKRSRGRILAELHRELGTITDMGQRTGWQRADEVAQNIDLHRLPVSDVFRTIALHLEGIQDRLRRAGVSCCPVMVIHGDFISQNLLFQEEELSGVLDFDSVHLDLRAADVACARRSGQDEVVRGYLEITPLADAELGCLDDLWRATVLRYALQILRGRVTSGRPEFELQWCLKQVEKTIPFDGSAG
jgi:Ser/Thr protein kinase RdoA (MazF antagonist)